MQIGYMRVSKADGSQATDLQRDALIAAGVNPAHLYEDQASGKREDRPGLASCLKALRPVAASDCPWPAGDHLRNCHQSHHHLHTAAGEHQRRP